MDWLAVSVFLLIGFSVLLIRNWFLKGQIKTLFQNNRTLSKVNAELIAKQHNLDQTLESLNKVKTDYLKKKTDLNELIKTNAKKQRDLDSYISSGIIARIAKANTNPINAILSSKVFSSIETYDFSENPRLYSAYKDIFPISNLTVSASMTGSTGTLYNVSLESCTCEDYSRTQKPCKHMYRLAILLGLPMALSKDKVDSAIKTLRLLHEQHIHDNDEHARLEAKKKHLIPLIESYDEKVKVLRNTALSSAPWLAVQLSDLENQYDRELSLYLRTKVHPAPSAADNVRALAEEKKRFKLERDSFAYRLAYYESLFPWLSDVSTDEEATTIYKYFSSGETAAERDPVLDWISPAEYEKFSDVKKNQLALDRWKLRHKSDWEIGIGFERYIGYTYERNGHHVTYNGALEGLSDFGRDLIVSFDDGSALIIQCKRWSAHKTVHEKHVFQLYGSVVSYRIDHPGQSVGGMLITTCPLSEKAIEFADHLGLEYQQNYPIPDIDSYPMIKCNYNGRNGTMIYHLPFDQQYDRVKINYNEGDFFAHTVEEAENAGFRRAYRWHSSS